MQCLVFPIFFVSRSQKGRVDFDLCPRTHTHLMFTVFFYYFSGYIRAAAALCVITLLTDLVATVLTGLGLKTKDHHTKYKYYRFAVIVMGLACKCY